MKAFIFDLNGTMINDMPYHTKAWQYLLNNELGGNFTWEEVKKEMYGKNPEVLVRMFGADRFTIDEMQRLGYEKEKKYIELQRISERTMYDLEMIREIGACKGIENYSRHFSMRNPGDPPPCLIDYFPADFLLFIDESHQTIPQLHAMFNGDRARKQSLVDFGPRFDSHL